MWAYYSFLFGVKWEREREKETDEKKEEEKGRRGGMQRLYKNPWKWMSLSRIWLCTSMDCSLPGSCVHGILQARILGWIAFPFSRGSSQPRDWTQVSHIVGRFFTVWATRKPQKTLRYINVHCCTVYIF